MAKRRKRGHAPERGLTETSAPPESELIPGLGHPVALAGDAREKRTSREALEAFCSSAYAEAREYHETTIAPQREAATKAYDGAPYPGDEKLVGRSKIVVRTVQNVVSASMPSLMRVFFGARRRVRFIPLTPAAVETAKQATAVVNQLVLGVDNPGYAIFHAGIKDAVTRELGAFKAWWDDTPLVEIARYSGLDEEALLTLASDDEVTRIEVVRDPESPEERPTYGAIAERRKAHTAKVRVQAIASEELLWSPNATSFASADFLDHCRDMRVGDLVKLGFALEDLLPYASDAETSDDTGERQARTPQAGDTTDRAHGNEMLRRVRYHEILTYAAMLDPERADLIKVCAIGKSGLKVLHWEPISRKNITSICPDPEPHTIVGSSPSKKVRDLQFVESVVMRMALDGGVQSTNPRLIFQEDGIADYDDIVAPQLGAPIREVVPNAVRALQVDYHPETATGLLEVLDREKENRVKQSRASQGLDADGLQSSTKQAVAGVFSAAQAEIELQARNMGETGIAELYGVIFDLLCRHQDFSRMVHLNGEFVAVDPRTWVREVAVDIEIALGAGGEEQEIATLLERKATQEAILQQYGPSNPLVTIAQYRDTLQKLDELRGRQDTDAAFNAIPADWQPPAPSEPGTTDADVAKIIAENARIELENKMAVDQAKLEIERAKLDLEREKAVAAQALEREKVAAEIRLKEQELELKRLEVQIQAAGDAEQRATNAVLDNKRIETDASVRREGQILGEETRRENARTAAEAKAQKEPAS